MTRQELLDSIELAYSPLSGCIYIVVPDKNDPKAFTCKSDFTARFNNFIDFLEAEGIEREVADGD